jgi:hypothetical protein
MHSDWLAIKGASWAWRNPRMEPYLAIADKEGHLVLQRSELAIKVLANDMARASKVNTRAIKKRWRAKGASA